MSAGDNGNPRNAAKNKLATDCYRKGTEALEKKNWDYALQMFLTCASMVMDNVMFRQLARNTAYQKYQDNKTGAGALAKSKLIGIRSKIKKARSKQEWDEADKLAEQGLLINPWDAQLNADLGEAARAREYFDVAKFAFTCARNAEPKSKEYNRMLAEILEEKSEFTEAAKVWGHIWQLDPNDGEARSRMTQAEFEAVRTKGGYREAKSTQDVAVQRSQLAKKPGEEDAPGMSVEKDLQHAIRKQPEKVENYLKLAHHYRSNRKLEEADKMLRKAMEVSGGDPNIQEQIEDVELDRMRANLAIAREKLAAQPDEPVYQQKVQGLVTELLKRELQVFGNREQRQPRNMHLKLELADRLMRIKKWPQAIPLLQKASQDSRLKGRAHFMQGKCFMHDNKLTLARGQFDRALPEISIESDPKLFLEAHYLMGRVCEGLGDKATAEKHYGEVITHEYEYKDALQRLETIQGESG
ncbi:MAG: tetratricopeptide repeat protein [Planctomycetaceae bacterium]